MLRLQSDERLITLVRRGNTAAFEMLVSRYQSRLLSFCRHLLGSREDAEDVLQDVLAAAFNAILADERPINVRPWLYRIARNRCLNHLRRVQAVGVDSMDVHLSEHGASTADKVHQAEEFRTLVGDIQELPETQKTALVLREMDALSYEQIAEAMETTVPSVKSLLVRARVSLAEAAEARLLTCDEVRMQLAEVAEGLTRRPGPIVRRHLRSCRRCSGFQVQLRETNKALTALLPIGPFVLFKKLVIGHLGHSAGAGSSASGAGAAGPAAAVSSTAAAGTGALASSGSLLSAGVGALASKAAAGLAAAALVTAGAVEVSHVVPTRSHPVPVAAAPAAPVAPAPVQHAQATVVAQLVQHQQHVVKPRPAVVTASAKARPALASKPKVPPTPPVATPATPGQPAASTAATRRPTGPTGRTVGQTDPTVLHPPPPSGDPGSGGSGGSGSSGGSGGDSGGGSPGGPTGDGGSGGSGGGPTGDGGSGGGGPTGDGGSTGSTPPPAGGDAPPPVTTGGDPAPPGRVPDPAAHRPADAPPVG